MAKIINCLNTQKHCGNVAVPMKHMSRKIDNDGHQRTETNIYVCRSCRSYIAINDVQGES